MLIIWNKIVRKIAYILTHKATSEKEIILNKLNSFGNIVKEELHFYLIKNNTEQCRLRKIGSDIEVYDQVVINGEYQPLIDFFKINLINPKLIIDCGANIGLTSMQFAKNFPSAQIISVEPDENNFEQLTKNTTQYPNVILKHTAIWSSNETLKIDRGFRDGKDWSIRTVKTNSNSFQEIKAISILTLLEETGISKIDLLKIDIEGAESELFKDDNTYRFLDKVDCIAIEIHDECANRYSIHEILIKNGFTLFNSGELTIGTRK